MQILTKILESEDLNIIQPSESMENNISNCLNSTPEEKESVPAKVKRVPQTVKKLSYLGLKLEDWIALVGDLILVIVCVALLSFILACAFRTKKVNENHEGVDKCLPEFQNSKEFESLKLKSGINDNETVHWIPMTKESSIPAWAKKGGKDSSKALYVARGHYAGELIPGKVQVGDHVANVAYGRKFGEEISLNEYEILVDPLEQLDWVEGVGCSSSFAIPGGYNKNGETYYICRVKLFMGAVIVGKFQWGSSLCYVPNAGYVYADANYEILIYTKEVTAPKKAMSSTDLH